MKKYSLILLSIITLSLITVPQPTSAFESRGNTSSAKWVMQSPGSSSDGATVIYSNPGDILSFSLTIQNTSKTDIFYDAYNLKDEPYPHIGAHELRVGATSDAVYDNIFDFSYGGPFEHNNRFIAFESGTPVFPGGQLTFYWNLKVKSNISNGSYRYAIGIVQEYDAWLGDRPGPGAGGSNNNLGGRSGGTIFWDIVIGGTAYGPAQYLTYTNSQYGFSFEYQKPTPPVVLAFDNISNNPDLVASGVIGIPDSGSKDIMIEIWREDDLLKVVNKIISQRPGFSVNYLYNNSMSWTVLKGHQDYADANVEIRIAKLPNNKVVSIESWGWFQNPPDYRFLSSFASLIGKNFKIHINATNNYSMVIPTNWEYTSNSGNDTVFSAEKGGIWQIEVMVTNTTKTLQQNADDLKIAKINDGYAIINTSDIVIDGQQAMQINYNSECCGGNYTETLVVYSGKLYTFLQNGTAPIHSAIIESAQFN